MYNARAEEPCFERLTFVLLGVATPADLIRDPTRTPFNIGQRHRVGRVQPGRRGGLRPGWSEVPRPRRAIFARIYGWTHGHPYLTQKLCLSAAEQPEHDWTDAQVDELVGKLLLSEGRARSPT